MKRIITLMLALIMLFSVAFSAEATGFTETFSSEYSFSGDYAEGQAVILIKSGNKNILKNKDFFGKRIKINKVFNFGKNGSAYDIVAVISSTDYTTKELIKTVGEKNCVYTAQPNYKRKASSLTDDSYSKFQWALDNDGQNGGSAELDLQPEQVWNKGVTSSEKVIAIVDSGIDFENEDLQGVFWTNENTRDLPGLHGYDFANNDTNPQDDYGHGTHCAGIISAVANNQKGISGINHFAKIMALKVLDSDGYGYDEDIISAFNYIYEAQCLGVDIVAVNNSFGSTDDSQIFKTIFNAIGEKGALLVCASGNESIDNDKIASVPANTDSPYCISVAASNEKDELAEFSNYGLETVDVAAPGTDILSTVSYDCYNPTLYSQEKQAEVSDYFNDFNSELSGIQILKSNNTAGEITVEQTGEEFFGEKTDNSGSAKVNIKNSQSGDLFIIKIPYTASLKSSAKNPANNSLMFKAYAPDYDSEKNLSYVLFGDTEDNLTAISSSVSDLNYGMYLYDDINYWEHLSFQPNSYSKVGQQRAFIIAVVINDDYDDDFTLYFDDLGVSKATSDTSVFGKYDFYNGTSMATPYVTGAIGLLSAYHKDLTPLQLKSLLISSTRKVDSFTGKIVSGGVLDLSKALNCDNIAPMITEHSSADGKITVSGEYFTDDISVKINGETAKILSKTDKKIEIDASAFANTKVRVVIENEKGVCTFTQKVLPKQLDFTDMSLLEGEGNELISDGNELYLINTDECTVSIRSEEEDYDEDFEDFEDLSFINSLFGFSSSSYEYFDTIGSAGIDELYPEFYDSAILSGSLTFEGKPCYLNGKIWFIANFKSSGNHYKLVSFNTSSLKWKVEGKLPDDSVAKKYTDSMLAGFNGKIYLLGGFSATYADNGRLDEAVSKMVRVFNETTDKWTVLPDMPEGRFGADVRQSGNKLVVSFGCDGTVYTDDQDAYTVPKTMIFDGKNWSVSSQAPLKAYTFNNYNLLRSDVPTDYYDEDYFSEELSYYEIMPVFSVSGGISGDGVIYCGTDIEKYGQFISYNTTLDNYTALNYTSNEDSSLSVIGTSVADKYYVYYYTAYNFDDDSEDYYDYFDESGFTESSQNTLYSFPIKSGCYTIYDKTKSGGKVTNCKRYLPGQTVTVKAVADKTHKFAFLTVDGVKQTSDSATVLTNKNITVVANFKNIAIKSIKLNFKNKTLKVKAKAKIKVKYKPTNATVKKVTYKSSNKKVATVNKKGVITAKGVGKAVITVKTKNGIKAKCKITVK